MKKNPVKTKAPRKMIGVPTWLHAAIIEAADKTGRTIPAELTVRFSDVIKR